MKLFRSLLENTLPSFDSDKVEKNKVILYLIKQFKSRWPTCQVYYDDLSDHNPYGLKYPVVTVSVLLAYIIVAEKLIPAEWKPPGAILPLPPYKYLRAYEATERDKWEQTTEAQHLDPSIRDQVWYQDHWPQYEAGWNQQIQTIVMSICSPALDHIEFGTDESAPHDWVSFSSHSINDINPEVDIYISVK